ncbi:MAG: alpha-galactosidase [Sporolactobacillus sp.]|nr:alpha-galactosidase [Sporolactobacillus sp.]
MPILFHEKSGTFHLFNDKVSYIMYIMPNKQLGQLYYGKKLTDRDDFSHLFELGFRDMSPCVYEGNDVFSLEQVKQEYPSYGSGDLRHCAFELDQKSGSRVTDFQYRSHRIIRGKPELPGLPSTYVEDNDEAETLVITLVDRQIHCRIELYYSLFKDYPAITRSARFINDGTETMMLNSAMSLNLDLPDGRYDMLDLIGAWGRERHMQRHPLHQGLQSIYSLRGHSSHNYNPFYALMRRHADEFAGEVLGFSLVYSGNFLGQVEVDSFHVTRVQLGIHPNGFRWRLKPSESFQTPEAVMVYSGSGLNKMSRTFHKLYRTRLARGYWRDRPRPILINNWEATYMKFDEPKLLTIAETAEKLGIELFVLDDGWFGERNDDRSSLGDWFVNRQKLPDGIDGLARKINALGMAFGLWFEPEMISKKSKLYRIHPDWVMASPDRPMSPGRHQYVLDMTKPEVVDYLDTIIGRILESAPISYVKWDMNRSMAEVFSQGRPADFQGEVYHRYILGVYELHERLTRRFPKILFESCASGGGRFDPGMLYYAPQAWTSDDTDAFERLKIQYGTSLVYPLSTMGCHVSAVPNHQTARIVSLEARGAIALFGAFGYELDLSVLSAEERQKIKHQIAFVKKYRRLIMEGDFYRLLNPFQSNETGWMVVSPDRQKAIVGYYRTLTRVNVGYPRLRLRGLTAQRRYVINGKRQNSYYGDELMQIGLLLNDTTSGDYRSRIPKGDFLARLFVIEAVQ